VCPSLVTIGFNTGQQQLVRRNASLAHGGGGNGRTLADRRTATLTVMVGPRFEERGILEKRSEPEGWTGILYIMGREGGRSSEGRKDKIRYRCPLPILDPHFGAARGGEIRMKGECEGERGECEGER